MLTIEWDDYHLMLRTLDRSIMSRFKNVSENKKIHLLAVPRGGTLIALHLTYLNPRYYAHFDAFETKQNLNSENTLVIDDVLETGKTRVKLMNQFNLQTLQYFAVLVDKSTFYSVPPADIAVITLNAKVWVQFPYEREEDEKEQKSKQERGYAG